MIIPPTKAMRKYPDGMPGLLTVKEFCNLIGVSRPTGLKIIRQYPGYTVPRGNTQLVSAGLYQMLTRDFGTKINEEGGETYEREISDQL